MSAGKDSKAQGEIMRRVSISKKLRFEVFKRDGFTCQYCGAKAPEVVLHCDHIDPVANGGATDILNLLTACSECNLGKGARKLSENSELSKQMQQLEELNARREQIEMMLQWRDELQSLQNSTVEEISARISSRSSFEPNDAGKADIKKWLKRFSAAEILRAADESFDTYLEYKDGKATSESWNKAFGKIPGVAGILKQEAERPYLRRLLYIQGIIRKRGRAPRYDCLAYLEHVHLNGLGLDEIESRAKRMRMGSLEDFEGPIDTWLSEIGKPF